MCIGNARVCAWALCVLLLLPRTSCRCSGSAATCSTFRPTSRYVHHTRKRTKSKAGLVLAFAFLSLAWGGSRSLLPLSHYNPQVSLTSMAEAFQSDVPTVESSMAKLIMDGKIAARIDSASKTVHVRHTEQRAESYRKVLDLSSSYLAEMKNMLLRMSCMEQDFVVKGRPSPRDMLDSPEAQFAGNFQDSAGANDPEAVDFTMDDGDGSP